jgi:hypothetical protein
MPKVDAAAMLAPMNSRMGTIRMIDPLVSTAYRFQRTPVLYTATQDNASSNVMITDGAPPVSPQNDDEGGLRHHVRSWAALLDLHPKQLSAAHNQLSARPDPPVSGTRRGSVVQPSD